MNQLKTNEVGIVWDIFSKAGEWVLRMTGNSHRQIGRYKLVHTLGYGGCAKVYLGRHIYMGTESAVKVLRNPMDSQRARWFLQEARTIANLEHPHIVRVRDFAVENRNPFLVMDYAPNGSLRQQMPEGYALPLDVVVLYIKQVALALQYAHDNGIIHRDVKPENILIGSNNELLLSDFGIALDMQDEDDSATNKKAGTVLYASPEQLAGRPCQASDQYALASVCYELLSGATPFTGTKEEIKIKKRYEAPLPLCQIAPNVPAAVGRVVMKALSMNPRRRFNSVAAFAMALEVASKEASRLPPRSNAPRRHSHKVNPFSRRIITLLFAIVLMLLVGGMACVSLVPYLATVTITPQSKFFAESYRFLAVGGKPDPTQPQVYDRKVSSTSSPQVQTEKATGIAHTSGKQARGTLTFYNGASTQKTIQAGTHCTISNGVVLVTDDLITLEAADPPTSFGEGTVNAHALLVGLSGNIAALSSCSINDNAVTARSTEAFKGGQAPQSYSVVTASDIEHATPTLVTLATAEAQAALSKKVHANEALSAQSIVCTPKVNTNPGVNESAKKVVVTVTATCSGHVYDKAGAIVLADNLYRKRAANFLGASYMLIGRIQTVFTQVVVDAQRGIIVLWLKVQGSWLFQFSTFKKQELVILIRGKSQRDASALLLEQEGVAAVDIQVPWWVPWFRRDTLPTSINRIKVIVQHP